MYVCVRVRARKTRMVAADVVEFLLNGIWKWSKCACFSGMVIFKKYFGLFKHPNPLVTALKTAHRVCDAKLLRCKFNSKSFTTCLTLCGLLIDMHSEGPFVTSQNLLPADCTPRTLLSSFQSCCSRFSVPWASFCALRAFAASHLMTYLTTGVTWKWPGCLHILAPPLTSRQVSACAAAARQTGLLSPLRVVCKQIVQQFALLNITLQSFIDSNQYRKKQR